MIHIDHMRVAFRNYRGPTGFAERAASAAVQQLQQLASGNLKKQSGPRTLDRISAGPVHTSHFDHGEDALARSIAQQAWRSIVGNL